MIKEDIIYIGVNDKEIDLFEVGGSWHDPYKDKFTI